MALRNILTDNDPGLLKKSRVVTDFNERLHILLDDMREILLHANGLGLAAPQVGVLRRAVLVVDTSTQAEPENDDEGDDEPALYKEEQIVELVNPEIISSEGEQSGSEGCLSLPGCFGMVTRPQTVTVRAQDRFGKEFEMKSSDMTARAVCHEVDHLDGIIFTSIAERMLTDEEIEEMKKESEKEEAAGGAAGAADAGTEGKL